MRRPKPKARHILSIGSGLLLWCVLAVEGKSDAIEWLGGRTINTLPLGLCL